MAFRYVAILVLVAITQAQDYQDYQQGPQRAAPARVNPSYSGPAAPRPTPIAILKQINRHNEDGSYTYGYEGGDGSFKIETKAPNGEVKGKYGYVDDTGKLRVVEYGATKHGFAPAGEGITVPPPTLVDETTDRNGNTLPEYSGQDFEQQSQYEQPQPVYNQPRPRPQQVQYQPASAQYSPAPAQYSPRPAAPVPQRAAIPGAIPSGIPQDIQNAFQAFPSRAGPSRSFAPAQETIAYRRPSVPIEEDNGEPSPAPVRQSPRITYAQAAPVPSPSHFPSAPQHQQSQYARPSPSGGRSGGILDQLSKEYALPQGGAAPLHDISFGYY